jgi:hypothetical protein
VKEITAVIYRDWRQRITNVVFVFWDLFVPVAYLALFGVGFERALATSFVVDGQSLDYTAYLLPGVIAITAFSVAMNTAWGFFMEKDSGIFFELLTYPITRRQLLIAKVCFNMLLSVLGAFLAILLGRFRDEHPHSLGTLAPYYDDCRGDNSWMVFPVEHFCHPLAPDGCLQHVHQRSLHLLDVPEHDVLSPRGIARMVSNGGANQSDDVASRPVAL